MTLTPSHSRAEKCRTVFAMPTDSEPSAFTVKLWA